MAEDKPKPTGNRIAYISLGIIAFLIIIAAASCSGKKETQQTTTPTKIKTEKEQAQLKKEYSVGEDVRVADVRWKLLSVKDRGKTLKASESKYPSIASNKTASGKFIEITMEVENLGKNMKSVSDLKLIDDRGREFIAASDVSEWIPKGKELFVLSNLNPNVPQQFVSIYEVSEDARGLKVLVGDLSLWGSEQAEISLGL